jgi:hypothetical protein
LLLCRQWLLLLLRRLHRIRLNSCGCWRSCLASRLNLLLLLLLLRCWCGFSGRLSCGRRFLLLLRRLLL